MCDGAYVSFSFLFFFFFFQDYLQEIMVRFCVVVTLAACCLVTGASVTDMGPVSGRYTVCLTNLVSGIIVW